MSLDWNVSKIKNSDEVCWQVATEDQPSIGQVKGESYMKPLTNTLIWATMLVDLGEITTGNVDEWMRRLRAIEADGVVFIRTYDEATEKWKDTPISREMVESHIGLRTNVVNISPAKFDRKMREHAARRAEQERRAKARKEAGR